MKKQILVVSYRYILYL